MKKVRQKDVTNITKDLSQSIRFKTVSNDEKVTVSILQSTIIPQHLDGTVIDGQLVLFDDSDKYYKEDK